MSDPVANVDIEDVLSSIRRLVSNGSEKDGERRDAPGDDDRLVLTPSQRVDGAARGGPDAETRDVPPAAAGITEAHPPEAGPPPDPEADITGDDMSEAALSGDTPSAGARSVADAEPGAVSADDEAGHDDAAAAAMVYGTDRSGGAPSGTAAGSAAEDGIGGTDASAGDTEDPALAGIAAMFARHDSGAPATWEPDGDDEDAFGHGAAEAPALDWRDVDDTEEGPKAEIFGTDHPGETGAHAQEHAEFDDRDAAAQAGEDSAFAIHDEAVLDEEALRDLVAEIVREELMGTLGERITRNVRKLVRREIHRALNSQDFD